MARSKIKQPGLVQISIPDFESNTLSMLSTINAWQLKFGWSNLTPVQIVSPNEVQIMTQVWMVLERK